jgi:hypothetical protein
MPMGGVARAATAVVRGLGRDQDDGWDGMEAWHDFFVAELGAAAALAGLLFVSLSVNQERILKLPGVAQRGIQALTSLFLVFAIASLALAPGWRPRSFGAAALAVTVGQTAILFSLQIASYRATDRQFRRKSLGSFFTGQAASWTLLVGSVLVALRNDWSGLACYPAGVILAFGFAGMISWVLLIEINR